jgi:CheY-like chemotaxis protein
MSETTFAFPRTEEELADFAHSVRAVLLHLYDNAFLQTHPLTAQWAGNEPGDRLTHAQELRRTLLDCIERLRPQSAAHGDAARVYAVLTYRCIDGLTIEEIEQKLGFSRRQTYRELTKGVDAVAGQLHDLLAQRIAAHPPTPTTTEEADAAGSRRQLAEAELARLGKAMRSEALALDEIVVGVCHLLDARLRARAIQVQCGDLRHVTPVLADRALLRQALLNLLSDTLDRLPDGAVLAIAAYEAPGSVHLCLNYTPSDAVSSANAALVSQREGVALTVAHSLVAAQNGRLLLDERAGAWSAEIVLATAQTPTLLIIDDNQTLIELFQRYLAGHRIVVCGATSGEAALTIVRQQPPQAIVLDVMMPHQDGWEVLQALRKEAALANVPILVCSVLREHDLALSLGASDTLVKPVSQPALLDALRRWLGRLHPVE